MNNITQATASSNATKLVLIVDDDSFSQELFSEMLRTLGITDIHTASNGRSGLRTLAALARAPDLLICDIFMPDMDGIEFLGELTKNGYAAQQVTEITAAAAAGDSATLGGVAHTLKSAARSVGALRLGELCQRLETAARVGNLQACKNLTGSLSRTFSHTRELIQVAMNTIAAHAYSTDASSLNNA